MLKVVENLWAVGALPETPLGSSQRSPGLLASWRGGCCPSEKFHPRSRPSVLRSSPPPMKNPWHTLAATYDFLLVTVSIHAIFFAGWGPCPIDGPDRGHGWIAPWIRQCHNQKHHFADVKHSSAEMFCMRCRLSEASPE